MYPNLSSRNHVPKCTQTMAAEPSEPTLDSSQLFWTSLPFASAYHS